MKTGSNFLENRTGSLIGFRSDSQSFLYDLLVPVVFLLTWDYYFSFYCYYYSPIIIFFSLLVLFFFLLLFFFPHFFFFPVVVTFFTWCCSFHVMKSLIIKIDFN